MSMREVTEAHYLHERHGLDAVLRPPVHQPSALAWIPGSEQLLVATRDGVIHAVDPVLGTTVKAENIGEAAVLAVHADRKRYMVLAREGHWQFGELGGPILFKGKHGYLGGMQGFFVRDHMVMVGNTAAGRNIKVISNGDIKAKIDVPARAVPGVGLNGRLIVALSTHAGLKVIPLGRKAKFPKIQCTAHTLRASGQGFLGLTPTGVAVWGREGGPPKSMRFPDLTAGDLSKDGRLVSLGTRTGAVALARMTDVEQRIRPELVRAFDSPVTSITFSDRGRWLATAAEGVQLWTWED